MPRCTPEEPFPPPAMSTKPSSPSAAGQRSRSGWLSIIGAGVLMLVYGVSPVDLVPDLLPVAGLLDDAALAIVALGYMIYRYRRMKG